MRRFTNFETKQKMITTNLQNPEIKRIPHHTRYRITRLSIEHFLKKKDNKDLL